MAIWVVFSMVFIASFLVADAQPAIRCKPLMESGAMSPDLYRNMRGFGNLAFAGFVCVLLLSAGIIRLMDRELGEKDKEKSAK